VGHPADINMLTSALKILGMAVPVAAGIIAIIAYFFPPTQNAGNASLDAIKPVASGPGVSIGPGAQITQSSQGSGSNKPNIVSGGNVNVNIGR
jgi:hypothetical protein